MGQWNNQPELGRKGTGGPPEEDKGKMRKKKRKTKKAKWKPVEPCRHFLHNGCRTDI